MCAYPCCHHVKCWFTAIASTGIVPEVKMLVPEVKMLVLVLPSSSRFAPFSAILPTFWAILHPNRGKCPAGAGEALRLPLFVYAYPCTAQERLHTMLTAAIIGRISLPGVLLPFAGG